MQSVDDARARSLLEDSHLWQQRPEVREAALVRSNLEVARQQRAANLIALAIAEGAGSISASQAAQIRATIAGTDITASAPSQTGVANAYAGGEAEWMR